jgi:hypothetical protein
MGVSRPATAKCRTSSSNCWSSYSSVSICSLKMQMLLRQLLETVSVDCIVRDF